MFHTLYIEMYKFFYNHKKNDNLKLNNNHSPLQIFTVKMINFIPKKLFLNGGGRGGLR
jgi:hypothetical protein